MSGAITLKLTSLLIRTVSKPIANAIKAQSKQSNFLKTNFIRFGQFINRVDVTLRNSSNSKLKIRPLTDNKAIEIGSNFLSEVFVFSVGASLIFYELTRSRKDKEEPEALAVEAETKVEQSKLEKSNKPEDKKSSQKSEPKQINVQELQQAISQLTAEVSQLKGQQTGIIEELNKLKSVNKPCK